MEARNRGITNIIMVIVQPYCIQFFLVRLVCAWKFSDNQNHRSYNFLLEKFVTFVCLSFSGTDLLFYDRTCRIWGALRHLVLLLGFCGGGCEQVVAKSLDECFVSWPSSWFIAAGYLCLQQVSLLEIINETGHFSLSNESLEKGKGQRRLKWK